MSETVLNLLLVIAIKCNIGQFCKMGRYCKDYYDKFPEAIKLKCRNDLDYIIKYVLCKKISNCNYKLVILVIYNIFRTRCLSPMYCVNLAETLHAHRSIINVCLKDSII